MSTMQSPSQALTATGARRRENIGRISCMFKIKECGGLARRDGWFVDESMKIRETY
jgi:hypothetical protein